MIHPSLFRRFLHAISLAACVSAVLWFSTVYAQSPHAATYTGQLTIELGGAFTQPPTSAGLMIFNVFPDGTVVEFGGDPVGTVNEAGGIVWVEPNTFNFTTGTIIDGTLIAESSTTESGLTRTLRINASSVGGAFPQGQTFTKLLTGLDPENGFTDHRQVIFTGSRFVAIGKTGTVAYSDDGLTWLRSAAPTARDLRSVAYGNGIYLVGGDDGVLFTSTDAVNWVARNSPFLFNGMSGIVGVTGAAYGKGTFVIASQFGQTATSPDGVAWTMGSGTFSNTGGLAYLNGRFAHWSESTGQVQFSDDGVTWGTPVNAGVSNILRRVAHGNGLWIAAGSTGIATSADGTTWTQVYSGNMTNVEAGAGRFVASVIGSGGATLFSTGPGATEWRAANTLTGSTGYAIAYGNGRFVIAGDSLRTSVDGLSWKALKTSSRTLDIVDFISGASISNLIKFTSAQRLFENSDGTREILRVNSVTPQNSTSTRYWVGPEGMLYIDDVWLKARADSRTTADLNAIAGDFVGGTGGVIRKLTMTGGIADRGVTVTQIPSPTTQTQRSGATYGNHTLMVGDGGTIVRLTTFPDTAVLDASGTTRNLRFVDAILTNNNTSHPPLMIAVGDHGTILTKPAGTTTGGWTARDSGTTADLVGVAYLTSGYSNNINGRYVAVGEDGTVISSVDSITWTAEIPLLAPGRILGFKRNQGAFTYEGVAFGEAGFTATGTTSATGLAFTLGTSQDGGRAVTHGAGRYVTVGGNSSAASTDGRHWQAAVYPGNASGVAFGSGRFVAVGGGPGSLENNRINISSNGLDWQRPTQPTLARQLRTVIFGSGRFIASGESGIVASSPNGTDWTVIEEQLTPSNNPIESIAHHGGVFVAVGGRVISSTNGGETWAVRSTPGFSGDFTSVTHGNGLFVAVGANRLYRSADGISFTGITIAANQTSNNTTPSFSHVFCADGTFVATTGNSQAFVSTDGVAWSERFTGVRGTFMGSVVANGLAVLATWEGKLIGLAIEDPGSPYVTVPPAAVTTRPAGSTLELSATTIGAGTLSYQWTRNGVPLVDGPPVPPVTGGIVSGATTPHLRVEHLDASDAGDYRLMVSNALGSRISPAAAVAVILPPVISTQPSGVVASPGVDVVFSVSAAGDALSYQWYRNSSILDGATSSTLEITAAAAVNVGLYTVRVQNPAGYVVSEPATLSLAAPGIATLTLATDATFAANMPELRPTNAVLVSGTIITYALRQLLVQPDGKLLVAGQFEYTGNGALTRHSLLRLNNDGTLDSGFNPPTLELDGSGGARHAANIEQVALLSDGRIALAGTIHRVAGASITATKAIMLNADGTHIATFSPSLSSQSNPYSIAVNSADRVIIGGYRILGTSAASQRHVHRFQTGGASDTSFLATNPIYGQLMNKSLVVQGDGQVVFSAYTGDFSSIRTYRVSPTGAVDESFTPADFGNSWVDSHTPLADDGFLVCGSFTSVNGTPRSGIARFAADGALDGAFAAQGALNTNFNVSGAAVLEGGFVLIGGNFATTAVPAANHLALLGPDGSLNAPPVIGSGTHAGFTGRVTAVAANAAGTTAYFGGGFTTFNGLPSKRVVRLTATGGSGGPAADLEIIATSASRTFREGDDLTLAVAAVGGSLGFKWFKGDEEINDASGPFLTLQNATAATAGTYRVEVTDGADTLTGPNIVLTLDSSPADPFTDWIAGYEVPAGKSGPFDDAGGNGLVNIIHFLTGDSPLDATLQPIFEIQINDCGATFAFRTAKAAAGVPFAVEATQDLIDFGTTVDLAADGEDENFHYWVATVHPADLASPVFVRLAVTSP